MPRGFLDEDKRNDDDVDPVTIEDARGVKVSPSGLALLVEGEDKRLNRWIPISVIHDDSEVFEAGTKGKLVLKGYWARQQGLE